MKEDAKEQVVHKGDDCGKEFKMRNHTKYDPVECICSQCGKCFKNPLSMRRHVETPHDEGKKAEMADCVYGLWESI